MHGTPPSEQMTTTEDRNECDNYYKMEGNGKDPSTVDTPGKQKLRSWLNKNLKIEMTDGRVLIGVFLCTDREGNVILGSCSEYLKPEDSINIEEPRVLGLVMVPGRHIVSIYLDDVTSFSNEIM
ncbi:N-alpha-acetyltransferase 38-A, NatC auxiliary subunit [Anabrus simplex]|uniref:N-alpha-acetyltransferase 38-A, NatC auxiliary subunit n=1 Tax=Anabrus simplex TaxID=316456 RepID=UPI0035A36CF2